MTTNGTNYAIGGARVTLPNASGVVPLSVTEQIDLFLASGRTFTSNDVVYIQGGGNDFFAFQAGGGTDLTILTAAATDLAAQVARLQAAGVKNIVTMSVQTGVSPAQKDFVEIDGKRYKVANIVAKPAAGTPVVFTLIVRR